MAGQLQVGGFILLLGHERQSVDEELHVAQIGWQAYYRLEILLNININKTNYQRIEEHSY